MPMTIRVQSTNTAVSHSNFTALNFIWPVYEFDWNGYDYRAQLNHISVMGNGIELACHLKHYRVTLLLAVLLPTQYRIAMMVMMTTTTILIIIISVIQHRFN